MFLLRENNKFLFFPILKRNGNPIIKTTKKNAPQNLEERFIYYLL